MPSINFTMFIEAVENGIAELEGRPLPHPGVRPKRQTIRALRKVPIKVGDTLHLFTGMRTKACRRLGTSKALGIEPIRLSWGRCEFAGMRPTAWALDRLASADGFADLRPMLDWFEKTHGLPFRGVVVRW